MTGKAEESPWPVHRVVQGLRGLDARREHDEAVDEVLVDEAGDLRRVVYEGAPAAADVVEGAAAAGGAEPGVVVFRDVVGELALVALLAEGPQAATGEQPLEEHPRLDLGAGEAVAGGVIAELRAGEHQPVEGDGAFGIPTGDPTLTASAEAAGGGGVEGAGGVTQGADHTLGSIVGRGGGQRTRRLADPRGVR